LTPANLGEALALAEATCQLKERRVASSFI
jgi:hypothetical protein